MSIPAHAKFPVPERNCHSPCVNASRRIASRFHGSRPTTNGAMARSASSTEAVSAPQHASPQPTSPSSVVSLTSTSLTPSRATMELTSRWRYGTLTGIVSRVAIFTLLSHRVLESRQDLVVRRTDREDMLESDATPARQVDRRLERQHHPLLASHLGVLRDPPRLPHT